jgi:hypothetical protein
MNMKRRRHQLVFSEEGGAELLCNGQTVWASDNDADFNDEFGDDLLAELPDEEEDERSDEEFEADLIDDVLSYLIATRYLTQSQADMIVVVMPKEIDQEELS